MVCESWRMAARPCDSCKSATATLYCRADSAFLCAGCDSEIHAANELASRHARVLVCDVCEQAPASLTCKADAAALCAACDRDIHSANPLARRHERFPVVPFYEPQPPSSSSKPSGDYFSSSELEGAEEAEAASWLLLNPNPDASKGGPDLKENTGIEYNMLSEMGPYLDLDMVSPDQKAHRQQQYTSGTDGVVPVQQQQQQQPQPQQTPSLVDGIPYCYDVVDYTSTGSKPFVYSFNSPSISQSVSSSSLDVGVVPEHNAMADDVSNNFVRSNAETASNQISGIDREARVLRYREKRKNRKFEKTIRYASRKAYAETRPRIKGRFAKRSEEAIYSSSPALGTTNADYIVVPSY